MLNKLPKKMGDPWSLTLLCQFKNLATSHDLDNFGASVNLMPYSFNKKLNLSKPRPICMAIHLAHKTVIFTRGICEDLLVKIDKFVLPADFFMSDVEEDKHVPMILGRPFLSTAQALVEIRQSNLTLRVGEDDITFGVDREMKNSKISDDSVFLVDIFHTLHWKDGRIMIQMDT